MANISKIEAPNNDDHHDTHRPWSQLPSELLRIISSKVTHIVDYIQFRSVCTSWRSNAKLTEHPLPDQLPHLIFPEESGSLSFFDLFNYRLFTSNFPEICNKIICGSSFGWLALIDATDSSLSLLNPFTRDRIQLPSPFSLPYYLGRGIPRYMEEYRTGNGTEDEYDLVLKGFAWGLIRKGYPWKVYLSTNPSEGNKCIAVVTLSCAAEFAFCRIGDETWTNFDTTLPWPLDTVVSHDQKFYVLDEYAVCYVHDLLLGTRMSMLMIESPDDSFAVEKFHVVRSDAELFMVLCYGPSSESRERVRLFKLDGIASRWSEVKSIGDYAIFVSGSCSSVARAVGFSECRKDCVYFSAPYGSFDEGVESDVYYVDVFDMKEGKLQPIFCPWLRTNKTATWITPTPC